VTTWLERTEGGRERGPAGVLRAFVEVLVRPRRFFRAGVAPGDQAPGLVFAVVVALSYATLVLATDPDRVPRLLGAGPAVSAVLALALVGLLVAPATLHLTAALQTVLLMLAVPDRAGVSETVQVVAYAAAPCVFAALPFPTLRAVCGLYAAGLLAVGVGVVHGTSLARATVATAVPSVLLFGYGFGTLQAVVAVLGGVLRWLGLA
jgi:hypothetical protein